MLKSSWLILQLPEGTVLPLAGDGLYLFKNFIVVTELWLDDDFEMIALELKVIYANIYVENYVGD